MTTPTNASNLANKAQILHAKQATPLLVTPQPTGGQGLALTANGQIPNEAVVYQNYTPVLNSSGGGGATLGNATDVICRFAKIGKFVHSYGMFILGSTTSLGSGNIWISLPVNVAINAQGPPLGPMYGYTGTNLAYFMPQAVNATYFALISTSAWNGALVYATATAPWTWAPGYSMAWSVMYEAAN